LLIPPVLTPLPAQQEEPVTVRFERHDRVDRRRERRTIELDRQEVAKLTGFAPGGPQLAVVGAVN
jgi:hypothetical protein